MSLLAPTVVAKSANYSALHGDLVLVDATGAARTVTLPLPNVGRAPIRVKKIDASTNTVTVQRLAAPATIDGASTLVLADQYDFVELVPDGTDWHVVANTGGGGGGGASVDDLSGTPGATDVIGVKVTGDAAKRFVVNADGSLEWGAGASAPDTSLKRDAANYLRISPTSGIDSGLVLWSGADALVLKNYDGGAGVGTLGRYSTDGCLFIRNDGPGPMHFSLSINGTHYVFDAAKDVVLGGSGAALATGATAGFTFLPNMAGTPSGAPTARTGATPVVVDTAASKLWAYIGGAWKSVTLA